MELLQQYKPARRFDDGGEVYDDGSSEGVMELIGDMNLGGNFGDLFGDGGGDSDTTFGGGAGADSFDIPSDDMRGDDAGYQAAQDAAERADRYGGLYEQAMSGSTDAMRGGTYNAARDSQAANEYLEKVLGVPRSEIDEAYKSQIPGTVGFGGKLYDTATGKLVGNMPKAGQTGRDTGKPGEKASGQGSDKSSMSWLLPLMLMMAAMNRGGQQQVGQAVIPKLSAERTPMPYQQVQRAPGYRPGQGGVQYVSDVSYKPMAHGGIADIVMARGGTPVGGKLLHGPGDGVSDSIPATIGGTQPARLARGEFVVDARTVSELGNGSTEAGAEKLYKMMERVHGARKKAGRGKDSHADEYLPA